MTNDELSVLLPQVELLIAAYEKGARKAINTNDLKRVENIALSLQISPMRTMLFAMNAMDSTSLTPEEIENEYKSQNNYLVSPEKKESTNELKINNLFDFDCEIVGGDEFYDKETTIEEGVFFGGLKVPKKVGKKFTNPIKGKVNVNLNPLFKGHVIEERSGKTISDCFDCKAEYSAEFMYPSIEVMWEFEKLLKGLLDAIKILKKNLDPASIYSNICDIKAFVGTNFLCPSMMAKIGMMLPSLFMKYSIDLGKISVDANFVLGGILKIAISAIATFLENLRALIVPFVDCAINAAKSVSGYVKSVAKAIAQGTNELASLSDKAFQTLHKTKNLIGEIFSQDPNGIFDGYKSEAISLEKLKEEYKEISEDLESLMVKMIEKDYITTKTTEKINKILDTSEFLLKSLPKEYGGEYEGSFELNPIIIFTEVFYKRKYKKDDFFSLSGEQFKTYLIEYFSENDEYEINNFDFEITPSTVQEEVDNILSEEIEKKYTSLETVEGQIKEKELALAKKKEEIIKENKDNLNYKMLMRDKKVSDLENMFKKEAPRNSKSILESWLKTRYSFNLENSYVNHEYMATKKFKAGAKKVTSGINSVANFIDKYIVTNLELIKKTINDFFGNIVNALKNLNIVLDQNAFSQFKVIGEILQLVHIIRAFKLIYKLIDEGFEGCEKLDKRKDQEKILKDAMEEISENKVSAKVIAEKNGKDEQSEEYYLKIFSKKGNYNHLLSLKDCGDASSHLTSQNDDLDLLYNAMKESLVK